MKISYQLKPRRVKKFSHKVFLQKDLDYLIDNHKTMTAHKISFNLGFSSALIYYYMKLFRLKPYAPPREPKAIRNTIEEREIKSKDVIAQVLEDYANNGGTLRCMSDKYGVSIYMVSRWITQYYLPKRQSEETKVIILQSNV